MSKCHHHWLLKGTISTPGPPPSYIMDFAFVITVVTTTTFILSWYLIAPFSRGCVSAFLGEYVPYFFSPLGFLGFSYQADAPQISTSPLQAHTTSDLLDSHISGRLLFIFQSTLLCVLQVHFQETFDQFCSLVVCELCAWE